MVTPSAAALRIASNAFATRSAAIPGKYSLSGRHRLHGRNPALSASVRVGKNDTFSRLGGRDAHEGLQKMPVVRTAKKNTPSKAFALFLTASHLQSASALDLLLTAIFILQSLALPQACRISENALAISISPHLVDL